MRTKTTLVVTALCVVIFARGASIESTDAAVLRFQRFVTTVSGDRSAEFMLSNTVSQSIWFTGYSQNSPLYSIEHQDDTRWIPQQIGWCGTGLDRQELKPNGSISFRIFVPSISLKPMRIGVSYVSGKERSKESSRTAWSEPIKGVTTPEQRTSLRDAKNLTFKDQSFDVWLAKIGGGSQNHYDACEAFRSFGKDAVVPLLERVRDERSSTATRVKVLQALSELGPMAREAIPQVVKSSSEKDNEKIQYYAVRALGFIAPDQTEACAAVMKHLDDLDYTLRYQAAQTLQQFGMLAESAVPKLVALGESPDPMLRARVAMTLFAIGPAAQTSVPMLKNFLTNDLRSSVPGYAAVALWRITGSDEGLPILLKMLKQEEPTTGFAANCVGEFGVMAKSATLDLLRLMQTGEPMTRIAAASALYAVSGETETAVAQLIRELDSRDEFVPGHAAKELGKIGPKAMAATDALKVLLKHRNAYVRQQAQLALQNIIPPHA